MDTEARRRIRDKSKRQEELGCEVLALQTQAEHDDLELIERLLESFVIEYLKPQRTTEMDAIELALISVQKRGRELASDLLKMVVITKQTGS